MSLSRVRRTLYGAARLLGDVSAVRRRRVGQRAANRLIGRGIGRVARKFWR